MIKNTIKIGPYLIIFFGLLLSIFLNSYTNLDDCISYTYNYDQNNDLINFIFDYSIKKQNVNYLQLDLIPNYGGLFCIGSELYLDGVANQTFTTSLIFYKLYLGLTTIIIFTLYSLQKTNSIINFSFVVLLNTGIVMNIFFSKLIFDYHLLISLLAIFIFYHLFKIKNYDDKNTIFNLFVFINIYFLLFNYNLFSLFSILFFYIYIKKFTLVKNKTDVTNLLKYSVCIYYFLRLIAGLSGYEGNLRELWQSLSNGTYGGSPVFADLYYVFRILNCTNLTCPNEYNGYGPFFELVNINNSLKISVGLLSIFIISFLIFFVIETFNNLGKYNFYLFYLFVSPPVTFVLERMNLDIFIFIFSYLAITLYKNNKKYSSLFIFSFLIQLKIYPIFFIFGLFLYLISERRKKEILGITATILLNSASIVYFLVQNRGDKIPNPYGISWTYGLPSHINNYLDLLKSSESLGIFFVATIFIFSFLFIYKNFDFIKVVKAKKDPYIYCFLTTFFLTGLFYNFDYRLSMFIFIIPILIKDIKNKLFYTISIIFLLTSVSPHFYFLNSANIGIIELTLPIIFVVINHITFYILIFVSIFYMVNDLNKYKINN